MRYGAILSVLLAASFTLAQPEAAAPAPPKAAKTIDQLLAELTEVRKKKAEAVKLEAATIAAIKLYVKDLDKKLKKAGIDVVPPGPEPGPFPPVPPKPPEPDVKPPIPGDGLRVLIVYETGDLANSETDAILRGGKVRGYLSVNCAKGPNGVTPEARIYDKDIDQTNMPQIWKDAMARPRKQVPWIIISNGKTGYEGPLPKNVDETIGLIDKYRK